MPKLTHNQLVGVVIAVVAILVGVGFCFNRSNAPGLNVVNDSTCRATPALAGCAER